MNRATLLQHLRATRFAPGDRGRALADAHRVADFLYASGARRVLGIGSAFEGTRMFTSRSDIDLVVEGVAPSEFYAVSARAANLTDFPLDLTPLECATAALHRVVNAEGVPL